MRTSHCDRRRGPDHWQYPLPAHHRGLVLGDLDRTSRPTMFTSESDGSARCTWFGPPITRKRRREPSSAAVLVPLPLLTREYRPGG